MLSSPAAIRKTKAAESEQEDTIMKGYYNNSGYMGYVAGSWVLFASEGDYRDYMED